MRVKRIDPDELLDRIKAVSAPYPTKAMAADLGKVYSTFDNELSGRGTSKLGLVTAARMLALAFGPDAPEDSRRAAARFLDHFGRLFDRVVYPIPRNTAPAYAELTMKFGKLSQEAGEALTAFGAHLADGEISPREADDLLGELDDVIRVAAMAQDVIRRSLAGDGRPA
jgi:hypothetical protein